jgi:transposase InsO family protein
MTAVLRHEGWPVNRKRIQRLMRIMALEAIYQKPNTSRKHPDHKVYPYLLRGLVIDRPNQVWCADITPGSSPGAGSQHFSFCPAATDPDHGSGQASGVTAGLTARH